MKVLKDIVITVVIIAVSLTLILWALKEFGVFGHFSALDESFDIPKTLVQSSEMVTPEEKIDNLIPSIPQRISIPSIGISDYQIKPFTSEELDAKGRVRPVDPNDVVWWTDGGRPGATEENGSEKFTTYVFGHSSNNPDNKVIFDDIDELQTGEEVVIDTENAKFTYLVEQVFIISKADFPTDPTVTTNQEGRLLLISCWSANPNYGGSTSNNVVVKAMLKSAEPHQ